MHDAARDRNGAPPDLGVDKLVSAFPAVDDILAEGLQVRADVGNRELAAVAFYEIAGHAVDVRLPERLPLRPLRLPLPVFHLLAERLVLLP